MSSAQVLGFHSRLTIYQLLQRVPGRHRSRYPVRVLESDARPRRHVPGPVSPHDNVVGPLRNSHRDLRYLQESSTYLRENPVPRNVGLTELQRLRTAMFSKG